MKLAALAIVAITASAVSVQGNVELSLLQEADSVMGQVQWDQLPDSLHGTPPLTGYEWEVLDAGARLVGGVTPPADTMAAFTIPIECGDTLVLAARVRAVGDYSVIPPWSELSAAETAIRECIQPEVIPSAPTNPTILITEPDTVPQDTLPTPPPDSVPPAPADAFFFEDYETGDRYNTMGGWSWAGTSQPVTCDPAEPAHTGNCSQRFRFKATAIDVDDWAEQRFNMGPANKSPEVWFEYWLYVPDNLVRRTAPGPNNDKFFLLWDENSYSGEFSFVLRTFPGTAGEGSATIGLMWKDTVHPSKSSWGLNATNAITPEMRGTWIRIRLHAALGIGGGTVCCGGGSTVQEGTGVFQLWVDDALVIDAQTLFWDPIGIADPGFQKGYLFGWSNSGYDAETDWYVDDLSVWNTPPAWWPGLN